MSAGGGLSESLPQLLNAAGKWNKQIFGCAENKSNVCQEHKRIFIYVKEIVFYRVSPE